MTRHDPFITVRQMLNNALTMRDRRRAGHQYAMMIARRSGAANSMQIP